ncbi:MAG: DUF4105 domain-containing protein [Methanococcaceae archaeon]
MIKLVRWVQIYKKALQQQNDMKQVLKWIFLLFLPKIPYVYVNKFYLFKHFSSEMTLLKSKSIRFIIICLLLVAFKVPAAGQHSNDTTIYLITCGPGSETYSIYGHSALRIETGVSDKVYNWGVFDFSTPNFAWKFAKGRLEYMLDTDSFARFVRSYFYEGRSVVIQKANLNSVEKAKLMSLIAENLKPENIKYRYDFFYDDCSTRIRDLFEKSVGKNLIYPTSEAGELPTFREMIGKYQKSLPWLEFGIDLIMGSPGDVKADFRNRMFLPIDMKEALSQTKINRNTETVPLLGEPEIILDFEAPVMTNSYYSNPLFVFTMILLLVIIFSALIKSKMANDVIDVMFFSVFSIVAVMMIFFNFFTDHLQMRMNFNIIWLNPLLIFCLFYLFTSRSGRIWFRIQFFISALFLIAQFFIPQSFNLAIFPLVMIILVRSSVRSGFPWNQFSIHK